MLISAIVAMTENRVIGKNNQLPWRLPADLRHFKAVTMGKTILMGRKTYESIGRLLPGRQSLILTRNKNFEVPGARIVESLKEALEVTTATNELMVIGGAAVYQELLPFMQRIYLTLVHAELEGDSYFPELNPAEWQQVSREDHEADEENSYSYSFLLYHRSSLSQLTPKRFSS